MPIANYCYKLSVIDSYVHNLQPFAIQFAPGLGVRWYGLAYLAGFFAAYWVVRKFATRIGSNMPLERTSDFIFAIALGTIIGGRLGYCFLYDQSLFLKFSSTFPFWGVLEIHHGGMASHGGIIGIVVACLLFARKNKYATLPLLDLLALAGPIGIFFGRIANFINGELVGRPCSADLPWAVKFPQDILLWPSLEPIRLNSLSPIVEKLGVDHQAWIDMLRTNPLGSNVERILWRIISKIQMGDHALQSLLAPLLTPRHPSQLYEALLEGLVLFLILLAVWSKVKKPGVVSASFVVAYAIVRIIGEQFRMPDIQIGFQWLDLTRGQWLSLLMLAVGLGLLAIASLPKKT